MKKLRLMGAVCTYLVVASFNVNAELLTFSLPGVPITIGSTTTIYDVTFVQDSGGFVDNSYNAIDTSWPGPLITFTDSTAASAAVDAILISAAT
ncbi:MAG: hypothetical protein WBN81_11330, partial [Gammaproteobacteria bacterium]